MAHMQVSSYMNKWAIVQPFFKNDCQAVFLKKNPQSEEL